MPLPYACPVCGADLAWQSVPESEGRPGRVDCMGRERHAWLVVNHGTPEKTDFRLGEQLD